MWYSSEVTSMLWHTKFIRLIFSFLVCVQINLVFAANEVWPDGLDRPLELPTVNSFDVMCGKDHMDIQIRFTGPFNGIVTSKGMSVTDCDYFRCKRNKLLHQPFMFFVGHASDPNCIYVQPLSGKSFYSFRIPYARCGTKPDLHGQFYENTVCVGNAIRFYASNELIRAIVVSN